MDVFYLNLRAMTLQSGHTVIRGDIMAEERKDTVIQIRLSSKLLSEFQSKCKSSAPKIVPAEWLRGNIETFVKDDEN